MDKYKKKKRNLTHCSKSSSFFKKKPIFPFSYAATTKELLQREPQRKEISHEEKEERTGAHLIAEVGFLNILINLASFSGLKSVPGVDSCRRSFAEG